MKYLKPTQKGSDLSDRAIEEWQKAQPFIGGAASVVSTLGTVPGAGMAASGVASILTTIARLGVNSVPSQARGFEWHVSQVTFGAARDHGVMQGFCWTLPKRMIYLLGGRLTGSVAVSFLPVSTDDSDWESREANILAHAEILANNRSYWAPAENEFVRLPLHPRVSLPDTSGPMPPHDPSTPSDASFAKP